jgi:ATP-dependent DNA helicase PIF1
VNHQDLALLRQFCQALEDDALGRCFRCMERWFQMDVQNGVCRRCRIVDAPGRLGLDEPYLYSAANHLHFGNIPKYLPQLTMVEEMLIARVHAHVNVMEVRGQQYKYRGRCVHLLSDTGRV